MKSPCCFKCYEKVTTRVPVAIMAFLACFMSYCIRLSFNLAIIAMVYPDDKNKSVAECAQETRDISTRETNDYGQQYNWDHTVQGQLKAAYGYGYFLIHFPAGILADKFGARIIVFCAIFSQAVLTALVPVCALGHWGLVFAVRFLAGLGGGMVYPSLHALVAQWAPPQEKGKFIFALMGGTFSTVVTWPVVGAMIPAVGWEATFYFVAAVVAVWSFVWLLLVYNSPDEHPFISEKEQHYIREAQEGTVNVKKAVLPIRQVIKCVPLLALVVAHYGNLWGLFLLTTDTPVYLNDVLGFSLRDSGFIGSLPALGRFIMSLVFGSIVDFIMSRHLWNNKTAIRKTFICFSHLLSGILMLSIAFVGCDVPAAVSLLALSLAMNGASTVTNLVNHHDLAPNYAGSLYGIMNGIGCTTLFIVPSVTGAILSKNNGMEQWKIIFWIGAAFYITTGIVFLFIGSAKTQSWNYVSGESPPEEGEEGTAGPTAEAGPAPAPAPAAAAAPAATDPEEKDPSRT